jgi:peptidoglycan/LPS O-acetylase OafA/YrhL
MAGAGVDLFLFLSGFGLTASSFKNTLKPADFYKKRLLKLFTPFWLVLIFFLVLDFFVLNIVYSWQFTVKAFLGVFLTADLYHDLNSPFWYFTLILFYYLVFPLVFSKKYTWVSAIVIYDITYLILLPNFQIFSKVNFFYQMHFMAFPLGMLFYWLTTKVDFVKLKNSININKYVFKICYYLLVIFLMAFISYISYSFGNQANLSRGQLFSIITTLAIIFLFLIKKIEFKLFYLFGLYSYEIYLFHWPLLYRYDLFYKYTPAWLATILYLIMFLGLGWALQKFSKFLLQKFK